MLLLELVIAIAEQLETDRDYFNLARTCKTYHRLLVGRPWNDIHIRFRPYWMEASSKAVTTCRGIRGGAVQINSAWQKTRIPHRQCSLSPCEACEIEVALLSVNAYLNCRARKVSKRLRELTLSGWLPKTLGSVKEHVPGHTLKGAQGVCALRPEILNVELRWATWSPIMLSSFDLTRLRSLKMPLRAPPDCLKIGAAFIGMPHLVNLTITELSDSQDFVNEFCHLGDGIMALSSSLRSLDITITNCNRLEAWEKDEAFVEPDDLAFFFMEFFPEPSGDRIEALVRARYNDPREPLDVNTLRSFKGKLNLERIRLKHIGLPWWTFQTVFNPETIKELDLPRCRIAPNIWYDLGNHATLHKLANINYEILSSPFMGLLSTQSSLHSLSFARPPDRYILAGMTSNFLDMIRVDSASFVITEEAPRLGPGTQWGRSRARNGSSLTGPLSSYAQCQYPKKTEFVKALSGKTSLKHLVLPADMFDITPEFMTCLAIGLPALESIEWGFDYTCPELRACFIDDFLTGLLRLKKITFLSLNRPHPLSDFDARHIHSAFTSGTSDLAPANLKFVRYRDLNDKSYRGDFTKSDVYYHRESMADGTWWLKIPARQVDIVFEDERTPKIEAIEEGGSKVKTAEDYIMR